MIKRKMGALKRKKELETTTVALKFMSSKKVMEIRVAMQSILEKINSNIETNLIRLWKIF